MSKQPHKRKPWYKLTTKEADRELAAQPIADRIVSTRSRGKNFTFDHSTKSTLRGKSIKILTAPNFSARGMRRIFGVGNLLPGLSCGMEMFLRKDGRVFVRFYSPGKRVTYRTYELLGLKLPPLPERGKLLSDDCVPVVLRNLYDDWVCECAAYPYDID